MADQQLPAGWSFDDQTAPTAAAGDQPKSDWDKPSADDGLIGSVTSDDLPQERWTPEYKDADTKWRAAVDAENHLGSQFGVGSPQQKAVKAAVEAAYAEREKARVAALGNIAEKPSDIPPAQPSATPELPAGWAYDDQPKPHHDWKDELGIGTRDIIEGVGSLPDIIAGPLNITTNAVLGTHIGTHPFSDLATGTADALGLPKAETDSEKMVSAIDKGAAGGLATGGAEIMPAFVAGLSGAGAGGASELVHQRGGTPLEELGAGLVGGFLAPGSIASYGRLAPAVARLGDPILAAFSNTAAERVAARTIARSATDLPSVLQHLRNGSPELVEGSAPTLYQATGDTGVGGLERRTATANPVPFIDRENAQNAARISALGDLQSGGDPMAVSAKLKAGLDALDHETSASVARATMDAQADHEAVLAESKARITQATERAQGHASAIPDATPDANGQAIRDAAEKAEQAASARARGLYNAVDPDGTLTANTQRTSTAARELVANEPATAKPMTGEEAAIFDAAAGMSPVSPARDLVALSQRVNAAMRQELMQNGRTPTYARLSQLRGAIQDNLTNTISNAVVHDNALVTKGELAPEDGVAARIQKWRDGYLGQNMNPAFSQTGALKNDVAITPSGREVPVKYAAVDADSLTASHDADGNVNPSYPSDLQPRDRARGTSSVQISQMAANLDPRLLMESPLAGNGAPIVSPEGIVESGNGRTLAIQRAYEQHPDVAARYRSAIEDKGFDTSDMEKPMLVRIRTGDMPRDQIQAFTREANARDTMAYSATEQAQADARSLPDSTLGLFRGGDIDAAGNREFVRSFMSNAVPASEHATMVGADGTLSQNAVQRIRGALLAKAYGDADLLSNVVESTDSNIKAIGAALTDVAGPWAKMRASVQDGHVDPSMDITPNILDAVKMVDRARKTGTTVSDLVNQRDMFSGDTVDPLTEGALRMMFNKPDFTSPVGRTRLVEALNKYVEQASLSSPGADLLGVSTKPAPGDILSLAKGIRRAEPVQSDLINANAGSREGAGITGPNGENGARKTVQAVGGTQTAPEGQPDQGAETVSVGDGVAPPSTKPVTQKQFENWVAHVDLRARNGGADSRAAIERDGFSQSNNVNALPAWMGGKPSNAVEQSYMPKKGDVVYLVPPGGFTDKANGAQVNVGWKPGPGQVVKVEHDGQSLYDLYKKALSSESDVAANGTKPTFDDAARDRLLLANSVYRSKMGTFGRGPLNDILRKAGMSDVYRLPAEAVPAKVWTKGPVGQANAQALVKGIGEGPAIEMLTDVAAASLRKAALRDDGTINPVAYARWRNDYSEALKVLPPDIQAKFGLASQASGEVARTVAERAIADKAAAKVAAQTIHEAEVARTAQMQAAQKGAIGKIMGATDPVEVSRMIGSMLGRNTSVTEMRDLVGRVQTDPVAIDGLRQAVADHINEKFISATNGEPIKAAQFQQFLRDKRAALGQVFSSDQLQSMDTIAADLKRSQMSQSGARLKNASSATAQDSVASRIATSSTMRRTMLALIADHAGGFGAGIGTVAADALRASGIKNANDLVTRAMLDPAFAHELLKNAPPEGVDPPMTFSKASMRSAISAGLAVRN